MCSMCDGCKRYMEAWKIISHDIPVISVGTRLLKNREDDRHFENLPTYHNKERVKVRTFSKFISDKKDTKVFNYFIQINFFRKEREVKKKS